MNKLFAAVALVAVIASPAFARDGATSGRTARAQYGSAEHRSNDQHWHAPQRHSSNRSYDVYDTEGYYVGSDPDPRIRAELRMDRNGRGY